MRKMAHLAALATLSAVAGCDVIFGLKRAELYVPDAGAGGQGGQTTSSSGSTGTGGSPPQPTVLAQFTDVQLQGMAADPSTGAVYITGTFPDQANFTSPPFTSTGGRDMFIAKLGASGDVSWAKQLGGPKDDEGQNIAFADHAITVVGQTDGGLSVEGNSVPDAPISGTPTFFAARYDEGGAFGWLSACTGQGFADIAVDPTNGDGILSGSFNGYQCGSQTYFPNQDRDIFITRLAATGGGELNTATYHGGQFNYADTVAVDAFKNIFIAGRVDTNLVITPYSLPDGAMYAARLNSNGFTAWATAAGKGTFSAIAVDANGDLFSYGTCADSSSPFGDPSMPASGEGTVCIAKVSGGTGSVMWARRFGAAGVVAGPAFVGAHTSATRTLAVNSSGNIAIAGSTNGPLSFDTYPINQAGYVAVLDGKTGKTLSVASLNFLTATVAFTTQDALVVAGTFTGALHVGTATLTTTAGQVDTFVAKFP